MPGSPYTNAAAPCFVALVAVLLAFDPDQRVAILAGAIWAAVMATSWLTLKRHRA